MALLHLFCAAYVLFLWMPDSQAQIQTPECYVNNTNIEVNENNLPGHVVADIGTNVGVTVTIDPNLLDYQWFEIKGAQLILKYSVDFENTTALVVRLACSRGAIEVDDITIVVTVVNLNDNPPVFKQTNITVNVIEDTRVGTVVVPQANVTATDADSDVLFYSLTGNPPEATDYFKIQGINNPEIVLIKALSYEHITFMQLTLVVMDGNASAEGTHNATATINVHILPADLRPPWFQPCTFNAGGQLCLNFGYTGSINVTEIVSVPLVLEPGPVSAVDGDKGLNEKIVYEIAGGNDNDTFSIDKDTGTITMNKPVNVLKTFVLHVMASQANNPFRYSLTTVEIEVVRKNAHKPTFDKAIYTGTVSEGLPVSSLIMEAGIPSRPLRIFAADDDFPDKVNPDIKYEIQNSTEFTVTRDGFLLTNAVLTSASTITLSAIARDMATLQEANTLITVEVTPSVAPPITTAAPTIPETGTTISKPSAAITTAAPTIPETGTTISKPSATITSAAPTIPETGTTISKPSGTSSNLPPGVNSTLPTIPSGPTNSATSSSSTTKNAVITGITGNSVTSTASGPIIPPSVTTVKPPIVTVNTAQPLTTKFSITGISHPTAGTAQSTARTLSQPGATKPSITGTTMATGGTVQSTTITSSYTGTIKPPIASVSPATDGTGQSTSTTTAQSGTVKPTTEGTNMTTSVTIQATSLMSSQTGTTKPFTTDITSAIPKTTQFASTTGCNCIYTVEHMVALGVTLGVLLAIALVLLGLITYKHYISPKKYKDGEDNSKIYEHFSNFQDDEKPNSEGKTRDLESQTGVVSEQESPVAQKRSGTPPPLKKAVENNQTSSASEATEEGEDSDQDRDNHEKEVRSILTKDRRMADDSYKAVWFKEDIDPDSKDDVVMIEDDSDAERNGSESDGDDDSGRGGSQASSTPENLLDPGIGPTASQSDRDTEENNDFF